MASPNTIARNAALAHLVVSEVPVDIEPAPKTAIPGEFAAMLREYGRIKNVRRATAQHAANRGRAIPTSGPGRRRAKAIRNRDAWREVTVTEPLARQRGRMYEDDRMSAAG